MDQSTQTGGDEILMGVSSSLPSPATHQDSGPCAVERSSQARKTCGQCLCGLPFPSVELTSGPPSARRAGWLD